MKKLIVLSILLLISLTSLLAQIEELSQREDIEMIYFYEVNAMRQKMGVPSVQLAQAYQSDAIEATALCYEAWYSLTEMSQEAFDLAWLLVDNNGPFNSGADGVSVSLIFFYSSANIKKDIRANLKYDNGYILNPTVKAISVFIAEDEHGQLYGAAMGYQ